MTKLYTVYIIATKQSCAIESSNFKTTQALSIAYDAREPLRMEKEADLCESHALGSVLETIRNSCLIMYYNLWYN